MGRTDVFGMMRSADGHASWAAVFNTHHRRAVRLAYLLTGDHSQAEDIVSDVFVRVEKQWEKGRVDNVWVYLRRAVIRESNSKLRRRSLERREVAKWPGDELDVRHVDRRGADHDQVWQALMRLPERQRATIVLRYYEDLSEIDTASALDISIGTVKRQTSRGLDRLQELLGTDSLLGGTR